MDAIDILWIDDDAALANTITTFLPPRFRFTTTHTLAHARQLLATQPFSLVVLSTRLPDGEGYELLQELLSNGQPVILLAARRTRLDRIVGLELGADDALTKPVDPRELAARISAVVRRTYKPSPAPHPDQVLRFGNCALDLPRRLLSRHGYPVLLTTGEFELLRTLVQRRGQVLSRDELAQLTRGRSRQPLTRTVDVQISRLRKAIEDNPAQPRHIQTVRCFGYIFIVNPI